ncbi:MAG: GlyGly-CTERM sorting domain-containing protein, partial [Anaerolineae bacterium]|nr:GlyGly-CTERM sorting domain-containing protein [Anaerolineae bacterium]
RTVPNLLTLPWDMTLHAARYGGNLGPMFLLLLPGLAVRRRRAQATAWLMAFVLLYVVFWASPVSSFQMRFVVPITPLLAVLAAVACTRPMDAWPGKRATWVRRAACGGVAILLLLNLPPFTSLHERDRVGWDGWLTHVIRQVPVAVVIGSTSYEDYLVHSVPSYAVWQHINTYLPEDARLLTFSGGDHLYSERDRVPSDSTIA